MPDLAQTIGATFRNRDQLVGKVARHVLQAQLKGDGRREDCVHPSEASHKFWCHRATYYRMTGHGKTPQYTDLPMSVVFAQGHEAHHKWQTWLWEMGLLEGDWRCTECHHRWSGLSPRQCPACEARQSQLVYEEVPVENEYHLISGKADGKVGEGLIEIKTIGEGTIRHDAPNLVKRYSYHYVDDEGKSRLGVDWRSLWYGIHRPFTAHVRQGMIYLFCKDLPSITYIYEPKFLVAPPKEFTLKFRYDAIEDILERCQLIRKSLKSGYPPKRPIWASPTHQTCKGCDYRGVCYGAKHRQGVGSAGRRKS